MLPQTSAMDQWYSRQKEFLALLEDWTESRRAVPDPATGQRIKQSCELLVRAFNGALEHNASAVGSGRASDPTIVQTDLCALVEFALKGRGASAIAGLWDKVAEMDQEIWGTVSGIPLFGLPAFPPGQLPIDGMRGFPGFPMKF